MTTSPLIGYITPWNVQHGIATYSEGLVSHMSDVVDVSVVGFDLTAQGKADFDVGMALDHLADRNIVHIQFDPDLYDHVQFADLVSRLRKAGKRVVLTIHQHRFWDGFPHREIDYWIFHHVPAQAVRAREITVIPLPVEFYTTAAIPPTVRSVCCLGTKSNPDEVEAALNDIGGGLLSVVDGHDWLQPQPLAERIAESTVTVLNYNGEAKNQISKLAVMALGVPRPLILTDSPQFVHVKDYPGVTVAANRKRLALYLDFTFSNQAQVFQYVRDRQVYANKVNMTYRQFISAHLSIYRKLLDKK